jgi:hypothetical protein
MKTFRRELISLINKHSRENGSNTPDYILAEYLIECLHTFDKITKMRNEWYGEKLLEGKILEFRNEFEKEIDSKHPRPLTYKEAEQLASDMNYHNMCARATLYPGVAIENIPKVTAEDLLFGNTETCPDCKGEGYTFFVDQGEPDPDTKCTTCNGRGRVVIKTDEKRGYPSRRNAELP